MSRFKTTILVDVEAVKASLPKNAFIHGIRFVETPPSVELEWEHDDLKTPYTFSMEFSAADLQAKKLPADVKYTAPAKGGTTQAKPIAAGPVKVDNVQQTNEGIGNTPAEPGEPAKPVARRNRRADPAN